MPIGWFHWMIKSIKKGQRHVCPINTRVINHHIYTHTYTPEYTCCEENEKCDVYQGQCNNF